jgi:hypothetical protein
MQSKSKSSWLAIVCVIAIFALLACDQMNSSLPTAPEQNQATALAKKGKGNGGNPPCVTNPTHLMWAKWDDDEEALDTLTVDPAGGVLQHAMHRLVIPAGALRAPVQVKFSTVFSDTMIFEFEPDGTQFAKPVTLVFNYNHACTDGVDVSRLGVVVWNPVTRVWDTVPSKLDSVVEEVSGDVTGFTPHFSRYAITK